MITNIKSRELNYRHFLDAVNATSDYHESTYFKDKLSIVGTYYENPLESKILSEPRLSISEMEDGRDAIILTLNADESEREGLDILNLVLSRAGIGVAAKEKNAYINDYYLALGDVGGELKEYLSKNTILDQVSDYQLTFIITEPTVEQKRYKINGVNYYQYAITSKGKIGDEDYSHSVHVLFKDKQYDGETFLTQFIGEELTRGEGIKILDTLSNENLTSLSIGTVQCHSKRDPDFNSFFVAYTSPTRLECVEGIYSLGTLESRMVFRKSSIKGLRVTSDVGGSYYHIQIETSENNITLHLV